MASCHAPRPGQYRRCLEIAKNLGVARLGNDSVGNGTKIEGLYSRFV
jgi:hypothetical protein